MSHDILASIRQQVASDIRLSSQGDTVFVGTPLLYDNGDHCGFYLRRNEDNWLLDDMGDILMRGDCADIDLLGKGRRTSFDRVMGFYGLSENHGNIIMETTEDRIGESIFTFAQASLELVGLIHAPAEKKRQERNKFRVKFSKLVHQVVPSRQLETNWHHPELDPNCHRAD